MIHIKTINRKISGFTLFEILATLLITAFLLQGLSSLTGSYLKGWNNSTTLLEDQSSAFNAFDSMAEEINGMLPITTKKQGDRDQLNAIFIGSANQMTFARPSVGFETSRDVDLVTYSVEAFSGGMSLVRYSSKMAATKPYEIIDTQIRSVLAEINGKISFEYADDNREFKLTWQNEQNVPGFIKLKFSLARFPEKIFTKTASPFISIGTN